MHGRITLSSTPLNFQFGTSDTWHAHSVIATSTWRCLSACTEYQRSKPFISATPAFITNWLQWMIKYAKLHIDSLTNEQTTRKRILENVTVAQLVYPFMESDSSLPCSQGPASGSYLPTIFPKLHFNIIFPLTPTSSEWFLSLPGIRCKFPTHFLSLPCVQKIWQ